VAGLKNSLLKLCLLIDTEVVPLNWGASRVVTREDKPLVPGSLKKTARGEGFFIFIAI
jgi:hypothetical protein